jgi:hypothetical protein
MTRVALEIPPKCLKPLVQTPQEPPTPRAQPAAPAPAARSPLVLPAIELEAPALDALTARRRLALQCRVTPRSEQKIRRSTRRSKASARGVEQNAVCDLVLRDSMVAGRLSPRRRLHLGIEAQLLSGSATRLTPAMGENIANGHLTGSLRKKVLRLRAGPLRSCQLWRDPSGRRRGAAWPETALRRRCDGGLH